jgi:hypothetical protein
MPWRGEGAEGGGPIEPEPSERTELDVEGIGAGPSGAVRHAKARRTTTP